MDKTTKISDKCLKCGEKLKEGEDVYCQTCIDADEKPEEEQPQDEEKGVDEEAPVKPQAFIEIHIDEKRGPICILNQELGVTPQLALELLLYVTKDVEMSILSARTARDVATLAKNAKTFERTFKGANRMFQSKK